MTRLTQRRGGVRAFLNALAHSSAVGARRPCQSRERRQRHTSRKGHARPPPPALQSGQQWQSPHTQHMTVTVLTAAPHRRHEGLQTDFSRLNRQCITSGATVCTTMLPPLQGAFMTGGDARLVHAKASKKSNHTNAPKSQPSSRPKPAPSPRAPSVSAKSNGRPAKPCNNRDTSRNTAVRF